MSGDLVLTDRAAFALIDEAERTLAEASTPEDADELWRKVKAVEEAARLARLAEVTVAAFLRLRLRAKRRWGELQPAPEPKAGPGRGHKTRDRVSRVSGADRKQAERARNLAILPAPLFAAFLEQGRPEADLLRAASYLRELTEGARESAGRDALARAEADGRQVTTADVHQVAAGWVSKPHPQPDPENPLAPSKGASPSPQSVEPASDTAAWSRSYLHERVGSACRLIRERGGEVEFAPDEADACLPKLCEAQRVLGNLIKRAEAAKQRRPDLTADELAAAESEAAQLGIELE